MSFVVRHHPLFGCLIMILGMQAAEEDRLRFRLQDDVVELGVAFMFCERNVFEENDLPPAIITPEDLSLGGLRPVKKEKAAFEREWAAYPDQNQVDPLQIGSPWTVSWAVTRPSPSTILIAYQTDIYALTFRKLTKVPPAMVRQIRPGVEREQFNNNRYGISVSADLTTKSGFVSSSEIGATITFVGQMESHDREAMIFAWGHCTPHIETWMNAWSRKNNIAIAP